MYSVAIIEDEPIIRKGLIYTVDWAGMNCAVVGEADNGLDGLSLISGAKPDIVVTDIRMPKLDGLDMLRQAGEQHDFVSIVLTGYSDFEYAKAAVELNAVDYLLKPIDEAKLEAALHKAKQAVDRIRNARQWEHYNDAAINDKPARTETLPENADNYYVYQTLKIIRSRYTERLSLYGTARELGISESYLARKFKEVTGMTFLDYLTQLRLSKAVQLMRAGGYRIGEISDLAGFSQYKQFSVLFRRHMGMPPTEYMKRRQLFSNADGEPESNPDGDGAR